MAFSVHRNRQFSKRILSTSKLFGSQGCSDDKKIPLIFLPRNIHSFFVLKLHGPFYIYGMASKVKARFQQHALTCLIQLSLMGGSP